MKNGLIVSSNFDQDALIVVVSRLCSKWTEIGDIIIDNGEALPIYQKDNTPLLGFSESDEQNPITKNPKATYDALVKLFQELRKKGNLSEIENIYIVIHDKELGIKGEIDMSYCVEFDDVSLCINEGGITQKRLAVLKGDNSKVSEDQWYLYLQHLSQETEIPGKHWELWGFIHESSSDINNCLNKGDIYSCLLEEGIKKNIIKPFSLLKHRIAHLFLSIDVDLQGIGVLRKQGAKGEMQNAANTPKTYLRDVLNNKEKAYYRQRLADLQFLVAKVSVGVEEPFLKCDPEPSGEAVSSALSESNLPDGKAMVDLILEGNRNDYSVILFWSALLNLSGLKPENRKKPFKNIIPDTDSSIFKFMCLMDCKIDKKNNISEDDVNDVMHFFAKIEGDKGRTVDVANVSPISSFHDWFCALVDCLEKLRKVIKSD